MHRRKFLGFSLSGLFAALASPFRAQTTPLEFEPGFTVPEAFDEYLAAKMANVERPVEELYTCDELMIDWGELMIVWNDSTDIQPRTHVTWLRTQTTVARSAVLCLTRFGARVEVKLDLRLVMGPEAVMRRVYDKCADVTMIRTNTLVFCPLAADGLPKFVRLRNVLLTFCMSEAFATPPQLTANGQMVAEQMTFKGFAEPEAWTNDAHDDIQALPLDQVMTLCTIKQGSASATVCQA